MSRLQFGVAVLLLCYVKVGQLKTFGIDELPTYPYCGFWFLGGSTRCARAAGEDNLAGDKDTYLYGYGAGGSGGEDSGAAEFTFTSLLEYTNLDGEKIYACGSSYIAQRWLLTAAHCAHEHFLGKGNKLTGARLREWNVTSEDDCKIDPGTKWGCVYPAIPVTIDRILIHPQFDTSNFTNDIALLRLANPVDWRQNTYLAPVCLPLTPDDKPNVDEHVGRKATVTGWGRTEVIIDLSPIKQKVELRVIPLEECRKAYEKQNFLVGETQLCTTSSNETRHSDACEGDSGGPLTVEKQVCTHSVHYQVGVVSFGKTTCGVYNFPAIFTRVSSYMDWIKQTISENKD